MNFDGSQARKRGQEIMIRARKRNLHCLDIMFYLKHSNLNFLACKYIWFEYFAWIYLSKTTSYLPVQQHFHQIFTCATKFLRFNGLIIFYTDGKFIAW